MDRTVKCDACGKRYKVPAKLAGKTLKCKACGGAVTIPAAAASTAPGNGLDAMFEELAAMEKSTPAGAGPGLQSASGQAASASGQAAGLSPALLIGGAVGVIVVGAIAVVVGLALTGGPTEPNTTDTGDPATVATNQPVASPSQPNANLPKVEPVPRAVVPTPAPQARLTPRPAPTRPAPAPAKSEPEPDLSKPIDGWQVTVDAGFQPPDLGLKAGGEFELKGASLATVVFPAVPGPYVMTSSDEVRRVIDLRTGRDAGGHTGEIKRHATAAMSPTGGRAVVAATEGLATTDYKFIAHVLDLKAGRPLGEYGLPPGVQAEPRLMMPDDDTLLVLSRAPGIWRCFAAAIKVDTGEVIWKRDTISDVDYKLAELSLDGGYLALPYSTFQRNGVDLIDMRTGETVGRTNAEIQSKVTCQGIAFSPDGRRLIGALDRGRTLVEWDLTTGRRIDQWDISQVEFRVSSGQAGVEYMGGGEVVLLGGRVLYDLKARRHMGEVPAVQGRDTPSRRVVGGLALASPVGDAAAADRLALMSAEQAVAAALDARDRARPDYGLPAVEPLRTADATPHIVAAVEFDGWNLPAPKPAPPTVRALLARPVPVAVEPLSDSVRAHLFAGRDGQGDAVVMLADTGSSAAVPQGIYRVNLRSGGKPVKLPLPRQQVPLAVSPDGSHAVFATGEQRMDVFQLEPWRHVAGWTAPDTMPSLVRPSISMPDNSHVWLKPNQYKTDVYLIDLSKAAAIAHFQGWSGSVDTWTPDGTYLLRFGEQVQLVNPLTGEAVAAITSEAGPISRAVVSDDGKRLVAAVGTHRGVQLEIYSLETGRRIAAARNPTSLDADRGAMQWISNDYILLDGVLIDIDTGLALWKYYIGMGATAPAGVSQVWFTDADHRTGRIVLRRHTVPHTEAQRAIATASRNPAQQKPLIDAGTRVRINLTGIPDAADYRKMLEQHLTDGGLVIDDKADFTFKVSRTVETETRTYESFSGGADEQVRLNTYTTTYAWVDAKGKTVWSTGTRNSETLSKTILTQDERSLQERVKAQQADAFSKIRPPTMVMPDALDLILGRSSLTVEGFRDHR